MLAVFTGPVRSGKSSQALKLALASGLPVFAVVGGRDDDEEMTRRIERHRADRPEAVTVIEAADDPAWLEKVPDGACLLVDCLGTILGSRIAPLVPEDALLAGEVAERAADRIMRETVSALTAREGPTVVVTNEVGWGIVPATPLGRLFRDVLGGANRALIDASSAAWLVVAGRCIDIHTLPWEVSWPSTKR